MEPVVDLVNDAGCESDAAGDNSDNSDRHLVVEDEGANGEEEEAQINVDGNDGQQNHDSDRKTSDDEHQTLLGPILFAPTVNRFIV